MQPRSIVESPVSQRLVMQHVRHPEIVKRLKRAHGHLASIITMLDEGRPCLELAQQIQAVESAITSAKRELIHEHIEHCLAPETTDHKRALGELKQLAKYL